MWLDIVPVMYPVQHQSKSELFRKHITIFYSVLGMTGHHMLFNLDQNYSFLISVCMDKASRLVWMDRWGANKLFAQLDSATAAAATAARKAAMEN